MKWPQHRDDPNFKATAPYNFVPQAERVFLSPEAPFARHDHLDQSRFHGWVDVTITTETPFYTRCAYPPDVDPDGRKNPIVVEAMQENYHHGDPSVPVIPGSSIRGAVRNLVEILSSARLTRLTQRGKQREGSRVRDERLVYRAVADQRTSPGRRYAARFRAVQAGWLVSKDGGWQIQPAKTVQGASFVKVPAHQIPNRDYNPEISNQNRSPKNLEVWLRVNEVNTGLLGLDLQTSAGPGLEKATVVPSGKMNGRKHYAAVFPRDDSKSAIPINEELWRQWEEDRDLKRGLPNREVQGSNQPVFYLFEHGELTFFGPTIYFRVPFERWTVDYVPSATRMSAKAASESDPDETARCLDLGEALFGTVNEGVRRGAVDGPLGAHRGRVSFDDAVCTTPEPFLNGAEGRRYPSILSAPKPTSFQMYLVQPNPLGNDRKSMKEKLLAWDADTPDEHRQQRNTTTLRGFKRYWHRGTPQDLDQAPPVKEQDVLFRAGALFRKPPTEHSEQYTRIRPVTPKSVFRGRIRFENLSKLELGAMIAALELPGSCRHHLGMGKPHGMGSVKLTTSVTLYEPRARYASLARLVTMSDPTKALDEARNEFRVRIIQHHNSAVTSPHLAGDEALWSIPRLAHLRELLEWERKPDRPNTANQSLGAFKERLPLPSPLGVAGKQTPDVDAEVPRLKGVVPLPTNAPVASPVAGAPALAAAEEVSGEVVRFTHQGIRVKVEGGNVVTVPVSTEVLPLAVWKKLGGAQFPPGLKVRVTRVGGRIIRVVPAGSA